jgi:hypothetical protein
LTVTADDSRKIGELIGQVGALIDQRKEDCERQAREHRENLARLGCIDQNLTRLGNLRNDFEAFISEEFAPVKEECAKNTRWRLYLIGAYLCAVLLFTVGGFLLDHYHEIHF